MKPYDATGTLMRCCTATPICAELDRDGGIAFAVWKCNKCGSEYSQNLAEINPEKARPLAERLEKAL